MSDNQENQYPGAWVPQFTALKCCVIIPTFNNVSTLEKVIRDVLVYTHDIIVVNDGSTDRTAEIISQIPQLKDVSYHPNQGKGHALRKGFEKALADGYEYAITIDSDGQHFADDIPWFIEKISSEPCSLIIGNRNMEQASVPGKSSIGNKISTFWFRFETGIDIPDTQSGFRLYPLGPMKDMTFYTSGYEFEIEVIVRLAWKEVHVTSVPIKVYYAPKETRISHFRPFQDFTRVGLLNTLLVIIAIFYIKPRNFLRSLKKKNLRERLHSELFNPQESNFRKAFSVGFGVFMGIAPFWGYQMLLALAISIPLKLNKVLVIVAANISLPPLIPVIIYLSYWMGGLVLKQPAGITFSRAIDLDWIRNNFYQYLAGSFALAVVSGICFGVITFIFLKAFRKQEA